MSIYDRERREREAERERSYISRADPRDKNRTLDYGDEDAGGSGQGSVRKRRESDGSASGRRDAKVSWFERVHNKTLVANVQLKRPRRGRTKTPEPVESSALKEESPALQSGSEEGEIEEL